MSQILPVICQYPKVDRNQTRPAKAARLMFQAQRSIEADHRDAGHRLDQAFSASLAEFERPRVRKRIRETGSRRDGERYAEAIMDRFIGQAFTGRVRERAAPTARAIIAGRTLFVALDTQTGRHARRASINLETRR